MIENKSTINYQYTLPSGSVTSGIFPSNTVTSENIDDLVIIVKSSSQTFLEPYNNVTQTVIITNNSSTTLTSIMFYDILSGPASYVQGSVKINGESKPTYNPEQGFAVPNIASNGKVIVEYDILGELSLRDNQITNKAKITYIVDSSSFSKDSNIIQLQYIYINCRILKSVDRSFVSSGDTITYTNVITNEGNYKYDYIKFTDTIPVGTTYVANSLKVDGTSVSGSPTTGITFRDFNVGDSKTVEFKVTVN